MSNFATAVAPYGTRNTNTAQFANNVVNSQYPSFMDNYEHSRSRVAENPEAFEGNLNSLMAMLDLLGA